MAVYKNNDEKSILASAEFDDGSNTAFFYVKHEVDVDRAKELLKASGQSLVAQSYIKGHTVIITQGTDSKEELFNKLASSADGGTFALATPEKPTFLQWIKANGWKLRGGSSVAGQSMTLVSAIRSVSKEDAAAGNLNPQFDRAIGAFAILNLAANFINYVFGGQKEEDVAGLNKFDGIIAEEINRYLPEGTKKLLPDDVRKLSYMDEQELKEHNKSRSMAGLIRQHSVRAGEVGLRTLGSLAMVFDYKKLGAGLSELMKGNVKKAFLAAKVADKNTFMAGCGMVAGKMMGLFAQTYDPNDPPKTYTGEIRQKVLWITSSFTEMIAQSFVAFDRYKNKRLVLGGKAMPDYTGVVGNVLLTVPPYPTRLVLPYGEKVLDVGEVQARLLDELHKIPTDKMPEVAARVTARMVEHMGEKSPSFSELYKKTLHKLHAFHGICVLPHGMNPAEDPGHTHFADKVGHKAAPTPDRIKEIVNRDAQAVAGNRMQLS